MTLDSNGHYLAVWLQQQTNKSHSIGAQLANISIEVRDFRVDKFFVVCQDGPKILVKPDASKFINCLTESQWVDKLWSDLSLSSLHYPIIVFNLLIFLFGTIGNVFVCLSVRRNQQLRNVTNYFIVNLAFADFLVILICLPATALWDLYLTWFFGSLACKLIMFLQDVSISVSVLTLTAISIDRYYAICHPLKFKSNLNQAKRVIALIWLMSLILMAPDFLYLRAKQSQDLLEAGIDTVLYSDCDYELTQKSSKMFQFVKTILLYLLPFVLMFCAHYKILKTLRKASTMAINELKSLRCDQNSSQFKSSPINESNLEMQSNCQLEQVTSKNLKVNQASGGEPLKSNCNGKNHSFMASDKFRDSVKNNQIFSDCTKINDSKQGKTYASALLNDETHQAKPPVEISVNGPDLEPVDELDTKPTDKFTLEGDNGISRHNQRISFNGLRDMSSQTELNLHNRNRIESRQRASKMLSAIVIIFGICYLPVHLINFLRQFLDNIPQNDVTSTLCMMAHCICYLNSAINPFIYNHMNSVFRQEFRKFLSWRPWPLKGVAKTDCRHKPAKLNSVHRSDIEAPGFWPNCAQCNSLKRSNSIIIGHKK